MLEKHFSSIFKMISWVSKIQKKISYWKFANAFDITNEIRIEFSDSLELKPAQIQDDAFKWYTWI